MHETTLEQLVQLAAAHQRAGRLAETDAVCRQILAVSPGHPDALHLLGLVALASGRLPEAASLFEQTIALQPGNSPVHSNLGHVYLSQQRPEDAVAAMQTAVRLQPERAEAHATLAKALRAARRYEETIAASRDALRLQPGLVVAHLAQAGAWYDLAKYDEAIACLRRAMDLDPASAEPHTNLALVFRALGKYDDAIACYRRVVELDPSSARAHYDLALAQLLTGDFRAGWAEYEWRWQVPNPQRPAQNWPVPRWDGASIPGETLLLHAEQGFGDTLQFARYVPLVRARSGARRVILLCPPELLGLLAPPGNLKADLISELTQPMIRSGIHRHLPLMSLPLVFGVHAPDDPAIPAVPYVFADPVKGKARRQRMGTRRGLRVGLAWTGNPTHKNDAHRSMMLAQFAPLAAVPDVTFFRLHPARPGEPPPTPPAGMTLVDPSAQFRSFADTAALIGELDLVISVDTAAAHLAGAMGRPVWTLVSQVVDWRWGTGGERTPWYPSMRLFRQRMPGDWDGVLREVTGALREWSKTPEQSNLDDGFQAAPAGA